MSMNVFYLIIFLLIFHETSAQRDSVACYYNAYWDEVDKKKDASYFRVGKSKKDKWEGIVRDYYISGKLQMAATFVGDKEEGKATYFYENGTVKAVGEYSKGYKTGLWKRYRQDGIIEEEGEYKEGLHAGYWKYYYPNGNLEKEGNEDFGNAKGLWKFYYRNGTPKEVKEYILDSKNKPIEEKLLSAGDSLGNTFVTDGNGIYTGYSKRWQGIETGMYSAGLREGVWKGGVEGKRRYIEEYKDGKLVKGESWDDDENKYKYTALCVDPEYVGGMQELMNYLKNNIRYPRAAVRKNIQGRVYIEFFVNDLGDVYGAFVKRGVHSALDGEALRVVERMPKWKPALVRGQVAKAKFILPVNFKIQ